MATFVGTVFDDHYTGGAKNQYGLDGNDTLSPHDDNKSYFLYGGNGSDTLAGYSYDDEVYGGADGDFLRGFHGDDYLEGGAGGDEFRGDYGNDLLSGGKGFDFFVFNSELNAKNNFDTVTDFEVDKDLFYLDKNDFSGIGSANAYLKAQKFVVGANATDSKQRIIYNPNSGLLFHDPDGNGPKAKVKFAGLDHDLALSHDDFWVI